MKRISVLSAICVIAFAQISEAQSQLYPELILENIGNGHQHPRIDPSGAIHSQFLIFNDSDGAGDSGTYNPTDSFGFDIYVTYSGYISSGLSLWFNTTANAAPGIFLTGMTHPPPFFESNPFVSFPLGFTLPEPGGFFTTPNVSDLGGTAPLGSFAGPGTYLVGHLSVSLNGLAPGMYILQSDTIGPHP